jgi:hypothetical protein
MSEGLRKKIIFAALPLALIWAVWNLSGRKTSTSDPTLVPAVQLDSMLTVVKSEPAANGLDYRKDAPWGRDPFGQRPTANAGQSPSSSGEKLAWVLAGIVYSNHQPMALIGYSGTPGATHQTDSEQRVVS